MQIYQECSLRYPESPLEALEATIERLDAAILDTDRLKIAVRLILI